jgi:hypothetical protein
MFGASEEMHVEHLQNNALNFVDVVCSVIAQPIEILLRWQYGTRYYAVPVTFFAVSMMIMLPAMLALFSSLTSMIPFSHAAAPVGMFSLGNLAELFFLVSLAHSVRLGKRMLHPETENHSEFEGPALPIFQVLPKGKSFWFVRIVWEPVIVLLLSIVLQDLFIIQPTLGLYLKFAALALMTKNFIAWHRAWEYLRKLLDMRISAPIMARLVSGEATEEELAPMHLCSFPKNLSPEIRQAAAVQIARSYSQDH